MSKDESKRWFECFDHTWWEQDEEKERTLGVNLVSTDDFPMEGLLLPERLTGGSSSHFPGS